LIFGDVVVYFNITGGGGKMLKMLRNKKGFTLVELIVVVVIIAVLAAVAAPLMTGNVNRARRSEAVAGCGTLRTAARLWQVENGAGAIPTMAQALNAAGMVQTDLNGSFYTGANYSIAATGVITAVGAPGTVTLNLVDGTVTGG
jgi:prepilin-type N-terminal cleavage/methylation domain-containing protein